MMRWKCVLALGTVPWLGACGGPQPDVTASLGQAQAADEAWVGAWAVSPQGSDASFQQQTLRQIVHPSLSGAAIRLRLSNVFGAADLHVDNVHIAEQVAGSQVKLETDQPVTFGGQTAVTIAPGAMAVSDAVDFPLTAFTNVAVSFYLPEATANATFHGQGTQDNYVAAGNVSDAQDLAGATTRGSYYFLTNLDVDAPEAYGAVVTLGASITDGVVSAQNANKRWPNALAVRLADAGKPVGVLNQGISGNKLLQDGAGESALKRFERDVIGQPGVRWVIFSDDPINDLGGGGVSADELIAAAGELIDAAHGAGIEFFCSTLTPYEGAGYWTPEGETARAAFNDFVRGPDSGCDAVVDQDEATHDPAQPTWYLPAFDAGDHLHPNEAGFQAIADAVELDLFMPLPEAAGAGGAEAGAGGGSAGAGLAGSGGVTAPGGTGGGSAGTTALSGNAGGGAGGSGGTGGNGAASMTPDGPDSSPGCGCRLATKRERPRAPWLAVALLSLLSLYRRRR